MTHRPIHFFAPAAAAALLLGLACARSGSPPPSPLPGQGGDMKPRPPGTGGSPIGTGGRPGPEMTPDTAPPPPLPPAGMPLAPRNRARVFFSGHSLIDGVPPVVLSIAQSKGDDMNYNQQVIIGSLIRARTRGLGGSGWAGYSDGANRTGEKMNVINELRRPATLGPGEKYDTLVITERHDILEAIAWEDTAGYLRHYHDRLIEGNPQGTTLLYHTWLDINKDDPRQWIDHEKKAQYAWECVASKVNLALAAAGRNDRVVTLPGGGALVALVEQIVGAGVPGFSGGNPQKLGLIFSDNVHLTPVGRYFIALVQYAAIFRKSPEGARPPAEIPAAAAPVMQRIAWEFVQRYYGQAKPGEHTMEECRSFIANNVCATFMTLRGKTGEIANCQRQWNDANHDRNPFRWPDPKLTVYPPP